ncbi:MAG: HIT family protein [Candidatus Microgenomates bacterium]
MENCIFCKIVKCELPCYKVWEDDKYLAFLDINPSSMGHTLVIPKKHYQWVYDVENFGEYWEAALTVTKKIQQALKPMYISYFTHGILVPHAHIHIIPRYDKDKILPEQKQVDRKELEKIKELINKT